MADPFSSFKKADFTSVSRPPPPTAAPRPPSRPHSAHPHNPSSPTNRARSHSSPVQPAAPPAPAKAAKPYKRVDPPRRVVYYGHVLQQSTTLLFHSYTRRYVLLAPSELWLYESEAAFDEQREPLRIVRFEKSTYVMEEGHSGNKIIIVSGGKSLVLKEERAGDIAEWKKHVEDAINGVKSSTAFNVGQQQQQLAVR